MLGRIKGLVLAVLVALGAGQQSSAQEPLRIVAASPTSKHVQHMSELLQLDAETHELLFAMYNEMLSTIQSSHATFHEKYGAERKKERLDYEKIHEWLDEYREQVYESAETFYRDAKLLVDEEDLPIVEHVERRIVAEWRIKREGLDISGLATSPFELLFRENIVDSTRFAELLNQHIEADRKLGELMEETVEAMEELTALYSDFGYDIANANADQFRQLGRTLTEELDRAKRLRAANEELAQSIIDSLDEEASAKYERAWMLANYKDVERVRIAETACERALADPELDAQTRSTIEEMRSSFGDRLRIARKMARVAKHKADLDYTMQNLIDDSEPDKSLYESCLERIDGIAESYAAALRGVLNIEQQKQYGLVEEEVTGDR